VHESYSPRKSRLIVIGRQSPAGEKVPQVPEVQEVPAERRQVENGLFRRQKPPSGSIVV